MNVEKISSLHDDALVPKATGHLGEYKNYPERFDPDEKSVMTRLEQFGLKISDIEELFDKKVGELTWEEYTAVMAEVIKGQYDVIVASVFDQYMFPSPESPEEKERTEKMLKLIGQFEGMEAKFGVNLVRRKEDFKDHGNLVLGLEAGAHLIKSVGDVRLLADKGVRLFGLQYGKDNNIAGANGLTDFGREIVKYFLDNNLIIDLAHSGAKTRQDVCVLAKNKGKGYLISYTHGSSEEDIIDSWRGKIGERALTQEEIREFIKMGGMIGLGVSEPFLSSTKKVAERIDKIAQLENGINHVAIGTDFGGVAPEWLNEIKSPRDFGILAEILSRDFGIKDEDINKVIRNNVKHWIKNAID